MAKNQRNKQPVPQPKPMPATNALIDKVIAPILEKDQQELLEREPQIRAQLEKIMAEQQAVTEAARQELQAAEREKQKALEQQTRLASEQALLKREQDELSRKLSQITEKQTEIEQQHFANQSEIDEQKRVVALQDSKVKAERLALLADIDRLDELKRNAELGFYREKQIALAEKKQALDQLQAESMAILTQTAEKLAQQERSLQEREQHIIQREAIANEGFVHLKAEYEKQREREAANLQRQTAELLSNQNKLKHAQAQHEATIQAIREQLAQQYDLDIKQLRDQCNHLETQRIKANERVIALSSQLAQYADLERELSGQDVQSVQAEMEKLRRDNRELRNDLSQRREEGLFEENQRLEEALDQAQNEVHLLKQDLHDKQAENHKLRMSAAERAHLQAEKRVLDLHKRTLETSISQLQTQIDDLSERQQGELPFKALNDMDSLFRHDQHGLQSVYDLANFVQQMQKGIAAQNLFYSINDIRLFVAGLAMSKLHLLQGISGTGKTSLARAFARAVNNASGEQQEKNYCEIVRVQAGWRDREDLLGHFNAFEKKFYAKEALQAIYRAQQPKFKDTVQIILLDEMNLSQPEQYFADFLSVLETPDRAEINLLDSANDKAPKLFIDKRAIKIPSNVWFIGTANHDETTKEFADKTYDRAHVMEIKRSLEKVDCTGYSGAHYSFSSLEEFFKSSQIKHAQKIDGIFDNLNKSPLNKALREVGVGWGNRLQAQAKKFIPVYIESGGSLSDALDHLLATKIFRNGKVTGRYDINAEKIQDILDALEKTWVGLGLDDYPTNSIIQLEKDLLRIKEAS